MQVRARQYENAPVSKVKQDCQGVKGQGWEMKEMVSRRRTGVWENDYVTNSVPTKISFRGR